RAALARGIPRDAYAAPPWVKPPTIFRSLLPLCQGAMPPVETKKPHTVFRLWGFLSDSNQKLSKSLITTSYGGEPGIRTLGTLAGTTDFESVPFDHSGNSPSRRAS